jgi:3-methyladenine DNA glycosylase AlkD
MSASPGPEAARADLRAVSSREKAKASAWFFKTGPGQYGEGDVFIGVTIPELRALARKYRNLNLEDMEALLESPVHEERALALLILVHQFEKGDAARRQALYDFYLAHLKQVNNWDLVDGSASYIIGPMLDGRPKELLSRFASSESLWERRIAMIATHHYSRQGDPQPALAIAALLLHDRHDLIHKAVGWMLREVGQRCGREYLTDFLDQHAATMPRTALRYAIEKFAPEERQRYLGLKRRGAEK